MSKKLCECRCGSVAEKGRAFAKYHRLYNGRATVWNGETYVLRYRLVMEKHLGRPLTKTEVVHHINHNKLDDRIENLALCANGPEHIMRYHSKGRANYACVICGKLHRNDKRRKHHFCSRRCWKKWKPPGARVTTGVGLMRELRCDYCDRWFRGKRSKPQAFCSRACAANALKGKPRLRIDNHLLTYQGETLSVSEWARRTGIPYKTLFARIYYGWTVERTLTAPVRDRGR
jgi:HNH endonuclease